MARSAVAPTILSRLECAVIQTLTYERCNRSFRQGLYKRGGKETVNGGARLNGIFNRCHSMSV